MKYLVYLTLLGFLVSGSCLADDNASKAEKEKTATPKSEYQKRKASNPEIAIETDFGKMTFELYRDVAPTHVDSTLARIREKFYDGLIFHRIIDGFMIQGGDPKGNSSGDAGYNLQAEFSKLNHIKGTLAMGRKGHSPHTASCQFYICLAPQSYLDGQYTIFGQMMTGYEALEKIGKVPTGDNDKPLKDVYIRRMYILKDISK